MLGAMIMLAIPTLGPGYATQYAYWWMPLLAATFPLFDREWRLLVGAFYTLATVTYVVEYAAEQTYGAFLRPYLSTSEVYAQVFDQLLNPHWQTVGRLPFFVGSLFILFAGIQRLRATDA